MRTCSGCCFVAVDIEAKCTKTICSKSLYPADMRTGTDDLCSNHAISVSAYYGVSNATNRVFHKYTKLTMLLFLY